MGHAPRTALLSLLTATLFALYGCAEAPAPTGPTNARIWLTDAPLARADMEGLQVILDDMVLFPADGSGQGIPMRVPGGTGLRLDLMAFREGSIALAAAGDVPPGQYGTLRLVIRSAAVIRDHDGDEATPPRAEALDLPSREVDVPVRLTITRGEIADVTLDFDALTSFSLEARVMTPVIHVARVTQG